MYRMLMGTDQLRTSLLAFGAVLSTSSTLSAQPQNILFGRTTMTFDSSFLAAAQGANVSVALLDGTALTNGSANFMAVSGTLDTASAAGEILHSGGLQIIIDTDVIRLQNFRIDTTDTSSPTVSALLVIDGKTYGRIVAFNELGSNFVLTAQAGSAQLTGINLYISSSLASAINSLVGEQAIGAGTFVGTETQNMFFSSLPSGND